MDSNHRPLPCQGSALTRLSYGPTSGWLRFQFYRVRSDYGNVSRRRSFASLSTSYWTRRSVTFPPSITSHADKAHTGSIPLRAEIPDTVCATQSQCPDSGCRSDCATGHKRAAVDDEQVRNIVSLMPLVNNRRLRIQPHPCCAHEVACPRVRCFVVNIGCSCSLQDLARPRCA